MLQALTQAATTQSASTTASAASTTAATSAAAAANSTAGTSSSSSTGSLVQDLQAFLHDLSQALRQVSRSSDGGAGNSPGPVTATSSGGATSAPASTTTAAATSTPVSSIGTTAGSTAAPAGSTGTAATPGAANTGVAAYGQGGIIAALQALVQDLAKSQEIGNTDSSSGLSANTLSNLNSAFQKLIGDLGGSTSTDSTSSSGTSSAGSSTSSGSAAVSNQSTAALQSFLTNFVQDLQNNAANSLSSLGSSVNTTA
jgi:hypothetical protein